MQQLTQHLATIVTKTLAQLDERNGEDLPRDLAGDTTQCLELLFGGCLSNEIGLELNWGSVEIVACSSRRWTLLGSKRLLLVHLVERSGNLGFVAEGHIDRVGAGGSSHGEKRTSSVDVIT